MRARWTALIVGGGLLAGVASGEERPSVVITKPGAKAYQVALQRFADQHASADSERPERLRAEIAAALEFSSLFRSLDARAFLGPEQTVALDGVPPITCFDWRQSGADVLLEGEIRGAGEELIVAYRVWDTARCRKLGRKRYRGRPADERLIARRIADDVVERFTGVAGVASTEIAFVSTRKGSAEVHVMDADGKNARAATRNGAINKFPEWSPDGRSIIYMSYRYRRTPHLFRLVRGRGSPGLLLPDLNSGHPQYRAVFSPEGKRLAIVLSLEENFEIFRASASGKNLRRLTRNAAADLSPSWSPDGERLAFVSDRGGAPQVYVMDENGGNVRRLTFNGTYNTAPAWSPDGRWIAYETRVDGQFDIWLIDPEGDLNVPLITHRRSDEHPTWSPDGRKLAFHSTRRGRADIYVVDLDGSHLQRLTHGKGVNSSPAWGPHPH
jgi:TolB protein